MPKRFRFGEFTLDAARASLHQSGAEVALRPKSFALLEYLVCHPGRVVTKDELLAAIWPGVVVTEDSLTRCVSEVRAALGDSAQTVIRTVTKRGYLFEATVTSLESGAGVQQSPAPPADRSGATRPARLAVRWMALASSLVLVAVVVAVATWVAPERRAEAPRLSVVVLPFTNPSADRSHDYLADVVTDDLAMALSRVRGAMVIAPGSAFVLGKHPADLRQLGAELGVRYALQGSVLRSDEHLRISAELVDVQTLAVLWSDRFDADRGDLLQTLDDIATRLASAIGAELVQAESRRPPLSSTRLDAEDLAMRCEASWLRLGADGDMQGRQWCEQALHLDPSNVRALVQLASWYAIRVSRMQSSDSHEDLARARELVDRALLTAPGDYAVHCAKSRVLEGEHQLRAAIVEAEHCARLNPSHAGAYLLLAIDHFFLAEPEQTLEFVRRGMRVGPGDPRMPVLLTFKGWAYLQLHQDEEAVRWLRLATASAPENPTALAALASALALTDRDAEAHATMARYLASKNARTRTIEQWDRGMDEPEAFRQFSVRFKDGLRKAGMPER